jgi:two-component system, NarL family, sensor histidine kinase DevS
VAGAFGRDVGPGRDGPFARMPTRARLPLEMDRRDKLIRSGLELASELELEVVLQRIVELAVQLTDATYGALGVLQADGSIGEFITTGVTPEQRAAIGDPPTGRGLLGLLIREPHPRRISRISDHPGSSGFPPNHPSMTSFLGAPVMARGKVFGNVYLTDKRGAVEFDKVDEEALVVLATQAGVAIENAHLYQDVERLALLEDRERIAKELHDGVIQALFAVGMGLEGTSMVATDPQVSERINVAVEELDHVIRDLRNYIFGLRPGILADRQLDTALRALVQEFQAKTGVVTIVEIDPEIAARLASVASDVVQLTREALSNVGRHARATTCRVSLRHEAGAALLEIDDDGTGFEPSTVRRGQGLANLEDRAAAMDGKASVISDPGEGTTVRVELPL